MKKSRYTLGINPGVNGMNYHDPSAVLVKDGEVIAAVEEERFNGIKCSPGIFPNKAIEFCLSKANISIDDVDDICIGYDPKQWKERIGLEFYRVLKNSGFTKELDKFKVEQYGDFKELNEFESMIKSINSGLNDIQNQVNYFNNNLGMVSSIYKLLKLNRPKPIQFIDHHLCHAASAYYPSNFDEALCIVIDGVGESSCTSIWKFNRSNHEKILDIKVPNSLGYFYAGATAFLGFQPWQGEGKLMALSPYGKPNCTIRENLEKVFKFDSNIYDISLLIANNLKDDMGLDIRKMIESFESLTGIPSIQKDQPFTDLHKDFAYEVQRLLEKSVAELVKWAIDQTGITNICCSGGVFLNCKLNMVIRELNEVGKLYVQPVSKDSGLALGAALVKNNSYAGGLETLSLGNAYNNEQIEECINKFGMNYEIIDDVPKKVAELLNSGEIVFWFQGSMEFGSRALGNRSILADPRMAEMADEVNNKIKHREKWRPFGCSVMEEKAFEILKGYGKSVNPSFMIEAFKVNDNWIDRMKAVIHLADNTTRPQVVSKKNNSLYYDVIHEFYKLTGVPLILNTSLNDKGQPIIRTPEEVLNYFSNLPIRYLSIGNYLVTKKD